MGALAVAADRESFRAALTRELPRMQADLRALEWSVPVCCNGGHMEPGCPRCGSPKQAGHTTRCRLGAIVRAVS